MRDLAFGLLCVLLAGCAIERYGDATEYRRDSPDIIDVVVPENALFISQQYFTAPSEDNFTHNGLDVWGTRETPILASAGGIVTRSYHEPLYGSQVRIDHGADDTGKHYFTRYFHLTTRDVKVGQRVERGEQIGLMGSTGLLGAAVHLHFEVHESPDGRLYRPLDPHYFWVGGVGQVTCFDEDANYATSPLRMTYPVKCR